MADNNIFDSRFSFTDVVDPFGIGRGLFGGGKKQKSPTEALLETLAAQRAGLGFKLKTDQQFAPKFLGLDLDLTREFSPQFAEIQKNVQRLVNPERAGALEQIGKLLSSRGDLSSLSISPEIIKQLQQDVRSSQAARGQLLSPVSSLTEAQATLAQRIAERDKFINLASQFGSGLPTIQPQAFSAQTAVPNLTPIQSMANQTAFQRFAAEEQQRQQGLSNFGNVLGTAGTLAMLSNPATAPLALAGGAASGFGQAGGQGAFNNRLMQLFPGTR